MYQIILGKSSNGGPINCYYSKAIEGESINFHDLTSEILEGLQSVVDIMVDANVLNTLSASPLETIWDLKCLQYHLAEQNVALLVTKIDSDVMDAMTNIIIKVVSPITDPYFINRSIDFAFIDKVEMVDVVTGVTDNFDLFNANIFMTSPIGEILSQLKDASETGIPSSDLVEGAINIITDLGFTIYPIYLNGK